MAFVLSKSYSTQQNQIPIINIDIESLFRLLNGLQNQTLSIGGLTITPAVDGSAIFKITNAAGTTIFSIGSSATGELNLPATSGSPAAPASGTMNIYMKGSKFIMQYQDGATTRWKYLDLAGTGVTWVAVTTAP